MNKQIYKFFHGKSFLKFIFTFYLFIILIPSHRLFRKTIIVKSPDESQQPLVYLIK